MEFLTAKNVLVAVAMILFGLGCAFPKQAGELVKRFKKTPTERAAFTLAGFILAADSVTLYPDVTGVAVKSINEIISFVHAVEGGKFKVLTAVTVLRTMKISIEGHRLEDVMTGPQLKLLELVVDGVYIDISGYMGDVVPEAVNREFARKFEEVLRLTLIKLKGI